VVIFFFLSIFNLFSYFCQCSDVLIFYLFSIFSSFTDFLFISDFGLLVYSLCSSSLFMLHVFSVFPVSYFDVLYFPFGQLSVYFLLCWQLRLGFQFICFLLLVVLFLFVDFHFWLILGFLFSSFCLFYLFICLQCPFFIFSSPLKLSFISIFNLFSLCSF